MMEMNDRSHCNLRAPSCAKAVRVASLDRRAPDAVARSLSISTGTMSALRKYLSRCGQPCNSTAGECTHFASSRSRCRSRCICSLDTSGQGASPLPPFKGAMLSAPLAHRCSHPADTLLPTLRGLRTRLRKIYVATRGEGVLKRRRPGHRNPMRTGATADMGFCHLGFQNMVQCIYIT